MQHSAVVGLGRHESVPVQHCDKEVQAAASAVHVATHEPVWHVVPVAQTVPQPPQFMLSVDVFTHVVPHSVVPVGHTHDPP